MKNKKLILALILVVCAIICSQLTSIFANTNYILDKEDISYKKIDNDNYLISGFKIGTTIADIKNLSILFNNYNIQIVDNKNNNVTNESNVKIGTGYSIKINKENDNEINSTQTENKITKNFKVIIYGDVNGDGDVGAVDALAIIKNKLGTTLFENELSAEAAKIKEETRTTNKIPASDDALYVIKYKLYPDEYPIDQKMPKNEDTTPVSIHGKLSLNGTNIVDKNGNNFQLKGVSTHGIAWFPQYINQDAFEFMRDKWGINTIRLAMYSNPNDGYSKDLWNTVKNGVDYATNAGIYAIIDWHVLNDQNPNTYKAEAIEFFKTMAENYKDNENVLYEICNEPNGNVTWLGDIKPYAEEVISEIRKIDNDAIIICGTPNWSQYVDEVSNNPIENYDNIVYTLHFYAATHKQDLRNRLTTALNNGLPIFVSEFGICDASGNGTIDENEANIWIDLLNENNISWICWNLSNKNESSAILNSSTNKTTSWNEEDLSQTGKWLLQALKR